jgi:transmembrane sensor
LVSTLPGQLADVTLLDGTKVSLGGDTKLVIAPDFGSKMRAVKLDGTALFTVAPGQSRPFQLRAGDATVVATGTTFGVRAYPRDDVIAVVVREGGVRVKTGADTRDVAAAHAAVVERSGTIREPSPQELESAFAWTDGRLVITERPLRDAIAEMARWYAYDIRVRDSTLLDRKVTVSAGLQSPRDAIAALERSGNLKFGYDEGRVMVLSDAAPPKK